MRDLGVMEKNKTGRAETILNKIFESPKVSIEDPGGIIHIDYQPLGLKASTFLYNTQQSTKKIDIQKYSRVLLALKLSLHLVSNTYAKQILEASESEETFLQAHEDNQEAVIKLPTKQKRAQENRQQKTRPNSKNGLTSSEKKTLDQRYLKGPAYLETKPSFTKYRPIRLRLPRLKVIVKNINEIWSVDLAYVDKLAKYKRNVKYLLVEVDCLSRYLRVGHLKTKYATETASAFEKKIKNQQPQKVWVDDGTEFLGAFKTLCNKRKIHLYSTFSEKKSAFAERNIRSLKHIIYKYLEEKWTYSYIDKLDQFVKTITPRVNRVTKLAPNRVTKKDVLRLVSLSAQTIKFQRPKFYVGDFVRIVKKDEAFRKGYKQFFTDEVFEVECLATFNPPTYSLIDANGDKIEG